MNFDINTLVLVAGLIHFIQIFIFRKFYTHNKTYECVKWWMFWSIATTISFMVMFLRSVPSLLNHVIIIQNSSMIAGLIFLYIGILRYMGKKEKLIQLLVPYFIFVTILIYYSYFDYDQLIRTVAIYLYIGVISVVSFYEIRKDRTTPYKYLSFAFLFYGVIFFLRIIFLFTDKSSIDFMEPNPLNFVLFIASFCASILWTYGFILIISNKINSKLAEAKDHFKLLFSLSPDDIAITRLNDGLIVNINESYSKITGYSKNEAVGKTTTELNLWIDPEKRKKFIKEIDEKGSCNNFEVDFKAKDGRIISGLLSARVIDISGEKHIISTNRDITGLKILEREKLSEAEKWEKTFDGISDSVFLLDKDGKILKYNSATEKILGEGYYIGKHCWEIVHKTTGHINNCPFVRMKESLKRESMLLNVGEKWHEVTVDPMLNDGVLTGAVHIISDITARKKSEDELNSSMTELRQMNNIMVGREIKMTELKQEINELLKKLGQEPKY